MEKLGLDHDEGSSPSGTNKANPQEVRKLAIQRFILTLAHACECHNMKCQMRCIQKMKRVVQHVRICRTTANRNCPMCKQFNDVHCEHAKYCQEASKLYIQKFILTLAHACECRNMDCRLPCIQEMKRLEQHVRLCRTYRNCPICKKLAGFVRKHAKYCQKTNPVPSCPYMKRRIQQAKLMRRPMDVMNTRDRNPSELVNPVGDGVGGHPMVSGHQPPHKSIGLKTNSQTPPANVLQVFKQLTNNL